MNAPSRRTLILKAAERLFQRYGPAKTTIADVAREADVAVGSVYLEFASKDALIEELSASRHKAVLAAMRAAAEQESRPFRDRLRAMLDARVESFLSLADEGAHACDLLACRSNKSDAIKAAQTRFLTEERTILTDLLRAGHKDGELDVPKPEAAARALVVAYMVFSPPWLFTIPREDLAARLRAMHELVLYGLVRRPS